MVEKIGLRLLGGMQIGLDVSLRRKNRAMLAYLALAARPVARRELAALFCQAAADPQHTLRLSLSRLRRALGKAALVEEGDTVWLGLDYFETDFVPFQQVLSPTVLEDVPVDTLAQSVSVYRGEFLAGFWLPDAPEFEMWLLGQRSYWQQLYERGALALIKRLRAAGQYATAVPLAQKLVQQNALLEEAQYQLIWLYAQTAQRSAAIAQFEQCQTILQQELAVAPSPDLQALYADILAGRLSRLPPSASRPPRAALSDAQAADFVGRAEEWARLQALWQAAQQGNGRALLITAPAGGGKTRLVYEWAQQLPPALFVQGACYESTRTLAYHPWLKILSQLHQSLGAALIKTLPAPWLDALSRLLPDVASHTGSGGAGEQMELFTAVHALLSLAPQPLLLFVDDWQWADAASLQLCHFLVERQTPLLLVGAYRPEEAEDNPALLTLLQDWQRRQDIVTLSLEPLSAAAVSQLINRLWPHLPPGYREPHLRDRLLQATGGNPLFVNEIVRELAGSLHLPEALPVPPSLRDLIQRRLRQLPVNGRQVLESLAILEQPATFDLVQQISARSEEETLLAIESGLRWRLLRMGEQHRVEYGHDLMRQAVWQQMSLLRRRLLHRRTAVALGQQPTPAATLAYHWHHAGDEGQEGHYAALAGEAAAAQLAHEEAVQYLQRARLLLRDGARQVQVMLALAGVWRLNGRWPEAEAILREALALVEEGGQTADVQAALGSFLAVRSEYEEAKAWLQEAQLAYEAAGNGGRQAHVLDELGMIYWRQGEMAPALANLQQAQALAQQAGDKLIIGKVTGNLGVVYWSLGNYEAALRCLEERLRLAEQLGDRVAIGKAVGNIGLVYMEQGRYVPALLKAIEKYELETELGNRRSMGIALGNMGYAYLRCGAWRRALLCHVRQFEVALALGDRWGMTLAAANMPDVMMGQREFAAAGAFWERVIVLARALNIPFYLCSFLNKQAVVMWQAGDLEGAVGLLAEALAVAQTVGRQEVIFEATVRRWQWLVEQGVLAVETAVSHLQGALQDYTEVWQQTRLWDALWQLDAGRTDWGQAAAAGYRQLYTERPDFEYRVRYEVLTGEQLPEPPLLPPLPVELEKVVVDFTAVLTELDTLIRTL
ncbi:MAG: AAA family ATPase [Ardenticatenaceae bacterium]|nr:AAA family ATPase [Ardenticatenaceae bacterium]